MNTVLWDTDYEYEFIKYLILNYKNKAPLLVISKVMADLLIMTLQTFA